MSSSRFTSLHRSGMETGAPGSGRALKGATMQPSRPDLEIVDIHLAVPARDLSRHGRDVGQLGRQMTRASSSPRVRASS